MMLRQSISFEPSHACLSVVRVTNKVNKKKMKKVSRTNVHFVSFLLLPLVGERPLVCGIEAMMLDPFSDLTDVINTAHFGVDRSKVKGEGLVKVGLFVYFCIRIQYMGLTTLRSTTVRASDRDALSSVSHRFLYSES